MKIKKNIAVSESGFVFDSNTGDSFSLNATGKEILNMLNDNKSEEDIKHFFLKEYDVDDLTFEQNYFDFMNILINLNLVEDAQ